IERMLCLLPEPADDPNGWYDITVILTQVGTRLTDNEDLIGADVIPIAALFAGDLVCLDLRYSFSCPVVVWDHEQSDDFQPVFETVADSFTEFASLLR
ncbi:MAG TPA: SMI1/KNR4 family protein, partial [Planctomycetaceae bacterium]|nr:SMI1/KNR4 family protein [Planctomycetaceae bacterium]